MSTTNIKVHLVRAGKRHLVAQFNNIHLTECFLKGCRQSGWYSLEEITVTIKWRERQAVLFNGQRDEVWESYQTMETRLNKFNHVEV